MTRQEECDRILKQHGPKDFERISDALDRQFRTIHNRAQLILGICGVLISASVLVTTGKLISRPTTSNQHMASILFVIAGVLEIGASAVVVGGVLNVRWITQQPGEELRTWVISNLAYRDAKTRAYRVGIVLVLLSMISYQAAIAIALLRL